MWRDVEESGASVCGQYALRMRRVQVSGRDFTKNSRGGGAGVVEDFKTQCLHAVVAGIMYAAHFVVFIFCFHLYELVAPLIVS